MYKNYQKGEAVYSALQTTGEVLGSSLTALITIIRCVLNFDVIKVELYKLSLT